MFRGLQGLRFRPSFFPRIDRQAGLSTYATDIPECFIRVF